MPGNLENSVMATGLENISFHFNPKVKQCQRMYRLLYSCTHFTQYEGNAQNPSSQASIVQEPRTSRCRSWTQKRQRNQKSKCQHLLNHRKSKRILKLKKKKIHFCFIDRAKTFDCVNQSKLLKILKEMILEDHLICLLRNLYADQEATVTTITWNKGLVEN